MGSTATVLTFMLGVLIGQVIWYKGGDILAWIDRQGWRNG